MGGDAGAHTTCGPTGRRAAPMCAIAAYCHRRGRTRAGGRTRACWSIRWPPPRRGRGSAARCSTISRVDQDPRHRHWTRAGFDTLGRTARRIPAPRPRGYVGALVMIPSLGLACPDWSARLVLPACRESGCLCRPRPGTDGPERRRLGALLMGRRRNRCCASPSSGARSALFPGAINPRSEISDSGGSPTMVPGASAASHQTLSILTEAATGHPKWLLQVSRAVMLVSPVVAGRPSGRWDRS